MARPNDLPLDDLAAVARLDLPTDRAAAAVGDDVDLPLPTTCRAGVPADLPLDAGAGEPPLPARIGKYRIVGRLGDGATSEVFLAEDDFNRRRVAIKRARPPSTLSADDERYHQCFFASEAALVGQLQHPNVVQIHDAVADEQQPYLVMEHVPGGTLRPWCRVDALLPVDQVIDVGFKCAMALAYVARKGLIHRDVKPANILVVQEGGRIRDVKISDFGSAWHRAADRTQVFRVGSLAYMSPEQLDGAELDARADIYSLGAVLFHLLSGRPPFEAPHAMALMHQICHAEPPSLATLRRGLPPRLVAMVAGMLAKRADDRPADWEAFTREWMGLVVDVDLAVPGDETVRDSERFALLRKLDFFGGFGDVELWEVVHRANWQRHGLGAALYRVGSTTRSFHIVARGRIDVIRDGRRVAQLGPGTSVGEMAYLAPSEELRQHRADVVVAQPATTIGFTPEQMQTLSPATRHLFDAAFIRVLVRRLHAAHEALHHPRRIL